MSCKIFSINYCPVKSLSFQEIKYCEIKKDLGILNDRSFAFSRIIDFKKAKLIENNPNERNLNNFLTLKLDNKELISISPNDEEQRSLITKKLLELESSLIKPISLLHNKEFPFYDTSHSSKVFNSLSLINLKSIKDFEEKIDKKIEFERFRGNFYVEGIEAWKERNWIGKNIMINKVSFKVESNIPRCVAINLKPKTDDNSLNLLNSLKKNYNHFDMGVYLRALNNGKIEVGDSIEVN